MKNMQTQKVSSNKESELAKIKESYEEGLQYFQKQNLAHAQAAFIKVLKVLSKPEMKNIHVKVEDCKDILLNSMFHLGQIHLIRQDGENCYAIAAAMFQYAVGFAKTYKVGNVDSYLKEAHLVESKFLKSLDKKSDSTQKELDIYKQDLIQMRASVKQNVDALKAFTIGQISQRAVEVEKISAFCTSFFVHQDQKSGLIQKLLNTCFKQLGNIPQGAEYAIFGLGSLSGGKMTPWSDLEFGILINEDKPEFKNYFRNLTKLLHIKVINLGETPLRSLGIEELNNFKSGDPADDWFWDEVTNNGFSFDGANWNACKLPYGRHGYKGKPDYELILTPKQLAAFQTDKINNDIPTWSSDKHLVQALKSVSLIHGSQKLLDEYRKNAAEVVDSEVIQIRAIEVLKEDLEKFSLQITAEDAGKLMDIKKSIYRIADRMFEALANYYDIGTKTGEQLATSWKILDRMVNSAFCSEQNAQYLKEALSIACELRLATYCGNNGQKESASTYVPAIRHLSAQEQKRLVEETFYLKDQSILHHFYYVMIQLQTVGKNVESLKAKLQTTFMFDACSDYHIKGMIYARFLDYNKAIEYMELAIKEQDLSNGFEVYIKHKKALEWLYDNLWILYSNVGANDKAIQIANEKLAIALVIHKDDPGHLDIVETYNKLGISYSANNEYEQAIDSYEKALKLLTLGKCSDVNIADNYTNLGEVYRKNANYDEAIRCFNAALEAEKAFHGREIENPSTATRYNNLAITFDEKGDLNQGKKYHDKALQIREKFYKDNPNHPDIGQSYINLGMWYFDQMNYDMALECSKKALAIFQTHYGNSDYSFYIAGTHMNIGEIYIKQNKNDLAKDCINTALKMFDGRDDIGVALCYDNLGVIYGRCKEHETSILHHNRALEIYYKAHYNQNHPDIAQCYHNLGTAYSDARQYDKAVDYFMRELDVTKAIYAPESKALYQVYKHLVRAMYRSGKFIDASNYIDMAAKIQVEDIIEIDAISTIKNLILVAACNYCILNGDDVTAKQYWQQSCYSTIEFKSPEFAQQIKIQAFLAFNFKSIPAVIDVNLVLLKLGCVSDLGAHYHNLACMYASNKQIQKANETFITAFNYDSSECLHVEYAQFLIIHSKFLQAKQSEISQHLYCVISSANKTNDLDDLEYNIIMDQDKVCKTLCVLLIKMQEVSVNPKVLAYHLLINHPEYIKEGDSRENLLDSMQKIVGELNNEVSYELLIDSCNQASNQQLANIALEKLDELLYEDINDSDSALDVDIIGQKSQFLEAE